MISKRPLRLAEFLLDAHELPIGPGHFNFRLLFLFLHRQRFILRGRRRFVPHTATLGLHFSTTGSRTSAKPDSSPVRSINGTGTRLNASLSFRFLLELLHLCDASELSGIGFVAEQLELLFSHIPMPAAARVKAIAAADIAI